MDKTDLYRKVYDRLSNPEAFTNLWWAKTLDGRSVMWDDPEAVKFDLLGALLKEAGNDTDAYNQAIEELTAMLPDGRIGSYSEKAGYTGTIHLLERALGLVEMPEVQTTEAAAAGPKTTVKKRGRPRRK